MRAEYGVDLRNPGMSVLDLADLTANLPPGCALFRATGGDVAWSSEVHMLAQVEHRLRTLAWLKTEDGSKGKNKPEPIRPPVSAHERKAVEVRQSSKAEAWARRTGNSL